jgi:hypothetical protein
MTQLFLYTTKVWITSVILSLIISVAIFSIYNPNNAVDTEGFFISVFMGTIVGLMFSAPSISIFLYVVHRVFKTALSFKKKRIFLTLAVVPLGFLPFVIAYAAQQITVETLKYSLIYVILIIVSIWFYSPFSYKGPNVKV